MEFFEGIEAWVKELSTKQFFIFDNVEVNNNLLGRFIYMFVLLFVDNLTNENYVISSFT